MIPWTLQKFEISGCFSKAFLMDWVEDSRVVVDWRMDQWGKIGFSMNMFKMKGRDELLSSFFFPLKERHHNYLHMLFQFGSVAQLCPTLCNPMNTRPPCPSPTAGVHRNPCALSRWCHPTILSSVVSFASCPQSFPASGSVQMSQFFAWGGQSIGVLYMLFTFC